jgi:hypothetical protein
MKRSKKAHNLLARMSAIERMERGKLCRMTGRNYYNLQAWHNGRNEVRYVPEEERAALQRAINGYKLFCKLAQQYADEIIQQTRREHKNRFRAPKKSKPRSKRTSR